MKDKKEDKCRGCSLNIAGLKVCSECIREQKEPVLAVK